MNFSSTLLVSCEDNGDKEYDEQEVWDCYIKYLVNWAIDHKDVEHFGEAPKDYEEWLNSIDDDE